MPLRESLLLAWLSAMSSTLLIAATESFLLNLRAIAAQREVTELEERMRLMRGKSYETL